MVVLIFLLLTLNVFLFATFRFFLYYFTQQTVTCLKLTLETPKKGMKYVHN